MPTDARTKHRRAEAASAPYTDAEGFTFHLLRIPEDIPTLHRWFQPERASFWLMRDKTEAEIGHIYKQLMDSGHATAYLAWRGGQPAFLAECYDPAHDRIRAFYDVQPGDLGMHIFIGPSDVCIAGYTRTVFFALMRFMFVHLGAARIVVEPDADNTRIHAINRAAGFVYDRNVAFPEKIASLAFCTQRDFEQATTAIA
ncbi:GNAT family N-acetyltransferase [Ralstonia sp. 25C]|uniref:GNAT family N-acetyltransferase n=1 Tax=Ralstonia sp. 25C TaxID=3447363 RepID=UPI003F75703D